MYPYSLVPFRKALSHAIDRSDVSKLGEYGYAPPTDALGLNGIFPTWVTGVPKEAAKEQAAYNPTLAKKMLTDAGFTYKGATLIDPKGNAVNLDIHVISGWSDWVASNQIITKNLQAIGINSSVELEPDWNSWYPNASAHEVPDAALAERGPGLAVRVLQLEHVDERVHAVRRRTRRTRATGRTTRARRRPLF